MAWIKFKDPMGKEFTVPESVFKNMFAGNSAFTLVQESKPAPEKKEEKKTKAVRPRKKFGVVTVATGDGLINTFKELGVDEVIDGGQGKNPSIETFINAFESLDAEHIFVLPNNGNIILAAEQSAEIYDKAKIHVIPAKNIGAGYVAVSSADLVSAPSPEEIIETMTEAIARISTGYVSPAIRDAEINGVHITNGDTIGIIEKEIVISKPEKLDAIFGLVEKILLSEDKAMLTIFYGNDSTEEERIAISDYLCEKFPTVEFYFIEGNQEISAYIFVAE